MKKSNLYVPDIFKGETIVKLTPSATWHGADRYVGKTQDAVLLDGDYYDASGARFVMGEGHWMLENEYDG